jgi:hypothetical protein
VQDQFAHPEQEAAERENLDHPPRSFAPADDDRIYSGSDAQVNNFGRDHADDESGSGQLEIIKEGHGVT